MQTITRIDQDQTTECSNLRVSYIEEIDCIILEQFAEDGVLLSEALMGIEEALGYAKSITRVCDKALGI
jgi:hypothetical protein